MATLPTLNPASPLDASDNVRSAFTNNADETISSALANTPTDFASMDTLSWTAEYLQAGRTDDTVALGIRVMKSPASTALTLHGASPTDASDDSRAAPFTAGTTMSATFALDNMPTDFGRMLTITSVQAEVRVVGRVDDTITCALNISRSGGASNLWSSFSSTISTNSTDTVVTFTQLNSDFATDDKTAWDAASIEFQQAITVVSTNDNAYIEVDQITITGTYEPADAVLAAATSAGAFATVSSSVTSTTDVTTGPTAFAYVSTTADKTAWDSAVVELQQNHTASMSSDGVHIEVDYVALTGTYTTGGAPAADLVVADAFHGHGVGLLGYPGYLEGYATSALGYATGYTRGYLGAVTSLTVTDAFHADSVDAIALVQQHSIALADALHGDTVDAVALVQQHSITLADAAHPHAVETTLLTQSSVLVLSDARHAHAVESPVLTQIHTITLADVAQAHTVEAVLLVQQHSIVVVDAAHDHATEVISLTQAHSMVLVGAAHVHAADTTSVVLVTVAFRYADAHLTGTIATPANVLDVPDGVWSTNSTTSWDSRFSMENPAAVLDGVQTITIPVRKDAGTGTPTVTVELWENGVFVKTLILAEAIT